MMKRSTSLIGPLHGFLLLTLAVLMFSCKTDRDLTPDELLLTPDPMFAHWHGPDGVLARFGDSSEIGAMLQFKFKTNHSIMFFDGTGKKFILDNAGKLEGPYGVDTFWETNGLKFDRLSENMTENLINRLNKQLIDHGVESVFYKRNTDSITRLTFGLKTGRHYTIYRDKNDQTRDTFTPFEIVHTPYRETMEAMIYYGRFSGEDSVLISDPYGEKFFDRRGNSKPIQEIWPGIPSRSVEAACHFTPEYVNEKRAHTFIILGEYNGITNGQHLYMLTEENGNTTRRMVDLRKNYD